MYDFNKRLFDIVTSFFAFLVLTPILIPIIIILKITSEGEIFYLQERVGFLNKPFIIYKFATMLKNSVEMEGGHVTLRNDPRLTQIGGFLRKSKINELPQLLNVFLGDMSVVGPRPIIRESLDAFPNKFKNIIYNVKPGLTGIGSIIFRDEEKLISNEKASGGNVLKFYKEKVFPFKGELEVWYQKNKSFVLDLKIILITAWIIIRPKSVIYKKFFKGLPVRKF